MEKDKKQRKMKIGFYILVLSFIFSFSVFNFAFAQGGPLVPCGGPGQSECRACDLITLANNIVTWAFTHIIVPLAALGLIISGLVLITAGGSETQMKKGKTMLTAIIVGFLIAATAWLIISMVLAALITEGGFNPLTESFPACT